MKLLIVLLSILSFSELSIGDEDHSLMPIAYYTPETSVAVGALDVFVFDDYGNNRTSSMQTLVAFTSKRQTILTITPEFSNDSGSVFWGGYFNYRFYPNEYYGKGSTRFDKADPYTDNRLRGNVYIRPKIISNYFTRLTLLSDRLEIVDTDDSAQVQSALNGKFYKMHSQGISLGLEYDTRNIVTSTTEGVLLKISQEWNTIKDRDSDEKVQSSKLEFEGKVFMPVLGGTLGHQIQITHMEVGPDFPFYLLQTIGGINLMKGFKAGEYRDLNLVMNQNEFRKQINYKWGYQGFINFAKLNNRFENVFDSDLRMSAGGGLSYLFNAKTQTKIRLDVGASEKSWGVYFATGETF